MWITGVRKLKGREQRCGHVSIWILFPSWWRPVEILLHPLSSHRGRGHCSWNSALAVGLRRQGYQMAPSSSHLHGAVKEYL
jgi:hypothetical protein